ncbi:MAG: methyltransferase family protein [Sporichthyaceae bacterium]
MQNLSRQAAKATTMLILVRGIAAFAAAGSLVYWQAWAMLAVMALGEGATTWYLARRDRALLERRLRRAAKEEGSARARTLATAARLGTLGAIVVAAVDHRNGWTPVPAPVWVLGDALIAAGLLVVWLAFRANSFAAATVQVTQTQKVVAQGPYASVRHPMYSGLFLMLAGIPLALDSLWGLVPAGLAIAAIAARLLDEERFLVGNLAGYGEYRARVRYRVAPLVW